MLKQNNDMGKSLRKIWNETCLNAGIPSISLDKAALTCAVMLEYGNNEAFTLNEKFLTDIEYIQKKFHIFGAETPDAEFAEALKEYVIKIQKFEKENGHDKSQNGRKDTLCKCIIFKFDKINGVVIRLAKND